MQQIIHLDVHTHLIPVDVTQLSSLPGVEWDGHCMKIDGHRVNIEEIYQPQALIDWMNRQVVAHAWISAPPPTYRSHLTGNDAHEWYTYLNEGLTRIAADAPDRLTALPHLPAHNPELAAEIALIWAELGAKVFSLPTLTSEKYAFSDPEFAPLWSILDRIGAVIFFHPGECSDGRLREHYLHNLLGNPYETSVAISQLVLGGVLEKHKKITPCLAHGGGCYPIVAARIQRGYDTARPGISLKASKPDDLLSRIHADCICHGNAPFRLSRQVFGEDNIHFGSDWPFPMGLIDPHLQLADLAPDIRHRIFQNDLRAKTSAAVPEEEK